MAQSKTVYARKIIPKDNSWEALVEDIDEDLQESIKKSIELQARDDEGMPVKIEKELAMTALILSKKLKSVNEEEVILDSEFVAELVGLLKRCENLATQYGASLDTWSYFRAKIIKKLKKERHIVFGTKAHANRAWEKIQDADELHEND